MLPMEFHYLSEFQAHQPDFDYLKSIEIPEKINSISWLQGCGTTNMLLSANDKQVKLWKVQCSSHHSPVHLLQGDPCMCIPVVTVTLSDLHNQ